MKRLIFILSLSLLPIFNIQAQQQDSTVRKQYGSVKEYLDSIVFLPVDSIKAKVDSLVTTLAPYGIDIQSSAAGLAFDYFNTSPIMGVEGVSVHIASKYFLNGSLIWKDSSSLSILQNFVDMNKSSLLGCRGEDFNMESVDGSVISLRNIDAPYKILYFYEPGCATCAKETKDLVNLLSRFNAGKISLFAVNISGNREEWEKYIADNFSEINNTNVTVLNMWDPEIESSYQMKYGVVKTPMMFLLDEQDIILGRKLNVPALSRLVAAGIRDKRDYNAFFRDLIDKAEPECTEDINVITDALVKRVGQDSTLYREVVSNLFEFYRNFQSRFIQDGATYLAERYIVGEPWYWTDRYVSKIFHMLEMNRLNPLETKATNLLLQNKHGKYTTLHKECRTNSYNLVLFHLISCEECEDMVNRLKSMKHKLFEASVKVIFIYTGHDEKSWKKFVADGPKGWTYLWDKTGESKMHELYDLEYVPHIYLLNGEKTIMAKDITANTLEEILPML